MSPEQAALLSKAESSLQAARLLLSEGFTEFAIGRAYYTMFYVAQAFLLGQGQSFSRHSAVIAAFGQRFAKTGMLPSMYHRFLIEAQNSRNVGDYDIHARVTSAQAEKQIDRAEDFLALARLHLPSANLQ